jgi:hypothetical protein
MLKLQAYSQPMAEQTRPPVPELEISSGSAATDGDVKSRNAIEAWDQVGMLTKRLTKTMMQKQASMISVRFRQGDSPAPACQPPIKKRRKLNDEQSQDEATEISDDENSEKGNVNGDPLPSFISEQVDRMARMSKYIMEIEYCHRMLREEMQEAMEN